MFKSLKNYSMAARLWVEQYEKEIEELGVANTFSGQYTDKETIYRDIEKQLDSFISANEFDLDITKEEAMNILCGR